MYRSASSPDIRFLPTPSYRDLLTINVKMGHFFFGAHNITRNISKAKFRLFFVHGFPCMVFLTKLQFEGTCKWTARFQIILVCQNNIYIYVSVYVHIYIYIYIHIIYIYIYDSNIYIYTYKYIFLFSFF